MDIPYKILSEVNHNLKSINIDDLKYSDKPKLNYKLSPLIDFDWTPILQNPLKNSDPKTLSELIYVANLTLNRTPMDLDLINRVDQDATSEIKLICQVYSIKFPQSIFDQFYDHTEKLILLVKNYFNRPRPYQLADFYNIKFDRINSDTTKTPSYPSGHTVYAKLAANIVGSQFPGLTQQLDHAVSMVAYARCSMGVHFPSDNKASIILANYIFSQLQSKIKV
jgi:hypothetical protein